MAQSPIIEERSRFRRDAASYPGTVNEIAGEGTQVSPRTWLIVAFAISIPLAIVTFWAAMTENWSVLAPVLGVIVALEVVFVISKIRGD